MSYCKCSNALELEMLRRLLKAKLDTGYQSLSYDEISMVCLMLGIEKEPDDD